MARFFVYGVVQGVGFRPTVFSVASRLGLRGFVLNRGSNVEICIDAGSDFIEELRAALPPLAKLEKVDEATDSDVNYDEYDPFRIETSKDGARGSLIPVDTSLCDTCKDELLDTSNRRNLYPFINCTDCGARYSLINGLPYDREKTAMNDFPMCEKCRGEYISPSDRRMHAQTISCPECGPHYSLFGMDRIHVSSGTDAVKSATEMLEDGKVLAIESWGGTHIFSTLENTTRARSLYHRGNKPFAIMLRDIAVVERYAIMSEHEKEMLLSPSRPIVILRKREDATSEIRQIMDDISPGLGNIGVMLPYSALHHALFHHFRGDGFVATSGNPPGRPMAITPEEALKLTVDGFLLHNRRIVQRVDDTVLRCFENNNLFIRRSRGFVPLPLDGIHPHQILSVGAELNVNVALSSGGRGYVSQYIGDTEEYDTLSFGRDAALHLMDILGIKKLDAIACDLHPQYDTRRLAKRFAKEQDLPLLEIQHHFAHARSLAWEHDVDEMVCLTLDGAGFGTDGTVWGGEAIVSTDVHYERKASLCPVPLIGGDHSTRDPRRLIVGICSMLGLEPPGYFDAATTDIMLQAAIRSPSTSSMGRVLDAVSYILGICSERTYDGEPAIRLEPYLERGSAEDKFGFEFETVSLAGVRRIDTLPAFERLLNSKAETQKQKADLSSSFIRSLINSFVSEAASIADDKSLKQLGITGGVSYSTPIVAWAKKVASAHGLEMLMHNRIPPGDGGISAGQNIIAGAMLSK